MTMYLRAKTNGIIMEYSERLAAYPEWESITEKEAFPERFAPVKLSKRPVQVVLDIPEEVVAAPVTAPPELAAQQGRIFGTRTKRKADAPVSIAGLKGEF